MGTAGSSSSRVNGPAPSDNGGPVDPKPKADPKRAAKPKSVKDLFLAEEQIRRWTPSEPLSQIL